VPDLLTPPPRFDAALAYAVEIPRAQLRKGTSIPYVGHLLGVATLVIEDGGGEDEAIAALLHDAVGDQGDTGHAIGKRPGRQRGMLAGGLRRRPEPAGGSAHPRPEPRRLEAQARAAHNSFLTELALRHGVGGTLYLSFVGAAQGALYGAIAGGGSGAGQGAWIGAAVGAGVGLVMGSIGGWSRARDARAAYEGAVASCRAASHDRAD
jgi:hypothetical protein